jgi:hypothetical protein
MGFQLGGNGKDRFVRHSFLLSSNVAISQYQRRRPTSIDLEEQLEAACAQASAAVEAARDASAQARSVRRGVAAVLSRVGDSLKRRPAAPPPSGD